MILSAATAIIHGPRAQISRGRLVWPAAIFSPFLLLSPLRKPRALEPPFKQLAAVEREESHGRARARALPRHVQRRAQSHPREREEDRRVQAGHAHCYWFADLFPSCYSTSAMLME